MPATPWRLAGIEAAGIAALAGYTNFGRLGTATVAATGVAAGGILAVVAETMIPEAFEEAHHVTGLITVVGFVLAFCLTKLGGLGAADPPLRLRPGGVRGSQCIK